MSTNQYDNNSRITIPAHNSINCTEYVDIPSAPSGYKRLTYIAYPSGESHVVACGFGSTYMVNCVDYSVSNVRPGIAAFFIRDI